MLFLLKVSMPVEAGNEVAHKGFDVVGKILSEQKPEAAYFVAEGGRRTGYIFINMQDASQIPSIAEPWFLALNAAVELTPAMTPADLMKAAPDIEKAVAAYAG